MTVTIAPFLVGFLFLWSEASALNCKDPSALQTEQAKCFTQFNITPRIGTNRDMRNMLQADPTAMCRRQEAYTNALKCALNVGKRCLRQIPLLADILPDAEKAADGIAFICSHLPQIDVNCTTNAQSAIQQCAIDRTMSSISRFGQDVKAITCGAFQLTYDCMKEEMDHCPGRTLEFNLQLLNNYLRPPACSSFAATTTSVHGTGRPTPTTTTTMAPITTAQLLTTVVALPKVSCYSFKSIQSSQQQCFVREGLQVRIPDLSASSVSKQGLIESVMANTRGGLDAMCRQKASHQRALGCAMDVARQCMPTIYRDYLPTAAGARQALENLCHNAAEIDFDCAVSKTSDLFDCGYNKGKSLSMRGDATGIICSAYSASSECNMEVLAPACGCRTAQVYLNNSMILKPPACPAISPQPPTTCEFSAGHQLPPSAVEDCQIGAKAMQCFLDEGLDLTQLMAAVDDGPGQDDQNTEAVVARIVSRKTFQMVCSQKNQFQRAVTCLLNALKQCDVNSITAKLMPDAGVIGRLLDEVCPYVDEINFSCTVSSLTNFGTCVSARKENFKNLAGPEGIQTVCKMGDISAECLLKSMKQCGCRTSQIFLKMSTVSHPSVCPALKTPVPRCDSVTGKYVPSANGASHVNVGLCFILMLLLSPLGFYR